MPNRPHTGRRRNEATRAAILAAATELATRTGSAPVTIETIAARAGVGKQTIYRWWPSKHAVLLEALTERARDVVPMPDTGSLPGDLRAFLTDTFTGASDPATAGLLRTVMADAQHDPRTADTVREFTAARRADLRELLDRGQRRGELPADADLDLIVDQVYGVLWYRLLVGHAPLDAAAATRLADSLAPS